MTARADVNVLRNLLLGHQDTLLAQLGHVRQGIPHNGLKGDGSEDEWRQMLQRHLPRRYRVSTGEVVDSEGACSEQIDLIIHDAHFCPLFLEKGGSSFVPAESVYAVFEVKQELTAEYVRAAGQKVASVRGLHRTTAQIVDCGVVKPARALTPILGGVLALAGIWRDGLGESFRAALGGLDDEHRLDLGCVLRAGAFEVTSPEGELVTHPHDVALVTFFLRLLHRLQIIGTVPAIDWSAYQHAFLG